ncbi:uncharacterized protein [Symphalangus syndactylus]|uniref:uncharacterized protein n=1 Tax=Symphalangus syndactylus TaxID=9590 RepID=UPI003003D556
MKRPASRRWGEGFLLVLTSGSTALDGGGRCGAAETFSKISRSLCPAESAPSSSERSFSSLPKCSAPAHHPSAQHRGRSGCGQGGQGPRAPACFPPMAAGGQERGAVAQSTRRGTRSAGARTAQAAAEAAGLPREWSAQELAGVGEVRGRRSPTSRNRPAVSRLGTRVLLPPGDSDRDLEVAARDARESRAVNQPESHSNRREFRSGKKGGELLPAFPSTPSLRMHLPWAGDQLSPPFCSY